MKSEILYCLAKTKSVKQWQIETKDNEILTTYGLYEGKLRTDKRLAFGKNIGRSNETTNEQQAESEANYKLKKKIEEGYTNIFNDIFNHKSYFPMLAQSAEKKQNKLKTNPQVCLQPKLDGVRMVAYWENGELQIKSRKGKDLNIPQIRLQLEKNLPLNHFCDGELFIESLMVDCDVFNKNVIDFEVGNVKNDDEYYIAMMNRGRINAFQITMKLVKKIQTVDIPELGYSLHSSDLEYHIYDYVNLDFPNEDYIQRESLIYALVYKCNDSIKQVPSEFCDYSKENLNKFHKEAVSKGYEGTIIRVEDCTYQFKHRSSQLLKYKDFMDAEFKIVGALPSKGTKVGCVIWICETIEGNTFKSPMKGTVEYQRDLYENREAYVGRLLKVRFQEYTSDNKPRFPSGLSIREEWDL